MARPRRQFCPRGHDTHIVGRSPTTRRCRQCNIDDRKAHREANIVAERERRRADRSYERAVFRAERNAQRAGV